MIIPTTNSAPINLNYYNPNNRISSQYLPVNSNNNNIAASPLTIISNNNIPNNNNNNT